MKVPRKSAGVVITSSRMAEVYRKLPVDFLAGASTVGRRGSECARRSVSADGRAESRCVEIKAIHLRQIFREEERFPMEKLGGSVLSCLFGREPVSV